VIDVVGNEVLKLFVPVNTLLLLVVKYKAIPAIV